MPIFPSPLSGEHCHAPSTTSPAFWFIEIQLGTQTMPISWHPDIEERSMQDSSPVSTLSVMPSVSPWTTTYDRYFSYCARGKILIASNSLSNKLHSMEHANQVSFFFVTAVLLVLTKMRRATFYKATHRQSILMTSFPGKVCSKCDRNTAPLAYRGSHFLLCNIVSE